MYMTLESLYPNHREYPRDEIRRIVETEGDESENLLNFAPEHLRAYFMWSSIQKLILCK